MNLGEFSQVSLVINTVGFVHKDNSWRPSHFNIHCEDRIFKLDLDIILTLSKA